MEQQNKISSNTMLPADWRGLEDTPPDEMVEVIDRDGNTGIGQPTYYPFEVVKKEGDERKQWGWRGTPVFYEDGKSKWDGGWMIQCVGLTNNIGTVVGWKPICR